jgi:nucleotide-binding universal stress UspA family protein
MDGTTINSGEDPMYKHILLPHDGSDLSTNALKQAITFAKSMSADLTVMHVVQPFHLHVQAALAPQKLRDKIEHEHDAESLEGARKRLADFENEAKASGVACRSVALIGEYPYQDIIAQAAKSGCDVIMMASHGRRGLEGLLLGSETVKVLTHSKIPVLVVR